MNRIAISNEINPTITPEGVQRRVMAYGGTLMLIEFTFEAGTTAAWHNHPHEQVSYVVKGEIDVNMEGYETVHLLAGSSFYVPSNAFHNIVTYAPSILADTFCPQRDEFLNH